MSGTQMRLYIGNKNYSSWSMRPWVLMVELGLPFEEVMVRFDSFAHGSQFKSRVGELSPAGKVPVLEDASRRGACGKPLAVWDTLAILEYLHESFPDAGVWPQDPVQRARARSWCADMHAGFGALRSHCPMNIEADLAGQGALIWRDQAAVRADVARLERLWQSALEDHGGPMLMGRFSAVDAYFAPVVMRLRGYRLPVGPQTQAYMQRILSLASVARWMTEACGEHDFLDFEEPYRLSR